jgi:hypothetical protein
LPFHQSLNPDLSGKRKGKIQAAFYSRKSAGNGKARHHEKDQVLL